MSVDQALRKARALAHAGDTAAAEQIFRSVIERFPGNKAAAAELLALSMPVLENPPESDLDRLVALYNARDWEKGLDLASSLLTRYPNGEILHNIAGALNAAAGRLDGALALYDRALELAPDFIEALNNRGTALLNLQRPQDALSSFDEAVQLDPSFDEAHVNRGIALSRLKRDDEALAAFDRAIRINSNGAEAYNNRGNLFLRRYRLSDALRDYSAALRLRPAYADAHLNLGNVLKLMRRHEEAVSCYDRAISLAPGLVQAYSNRATVLRTLKRPEEALVSLEAALRLKPDDAVAHAELLDLNAHLCRWTANGPDLSLLDGASGTQAIPPFYMLHFSDDPKRQLIAASRWCEEKFGGIQTGNSNRAAGGGKIRLGYFSSDFHNHATMYLMARLFELHDRTKFEVHAFSYGVSTRDEMRSRLLIAVDHFHDVAEMDDRSVAELANVTGIDIAVDLKGYTEGGRLGIFAHRAAPVQISYLGYPGTTGADFIDYALADEIVIPAEAQANYSERVIYLPHSYQVNDDQRLIAADTPARVDVGLPEHSFVYCCFNNNYKITPVEFDIWMRLLREVDGSVLWLLRDSEMAAENLRLEATRRGVDPDRLVFADRAPLAEHLARHRCADLFLDTFNVNAHTTASDALWAGLPVLTKVGSSFAARVAGSLLYALGVPELVTESADQYEALALDLARNRDKLTETRRKISDNRAQAPLFNTPLFARNIERIYEDLMSEAASRTSP